MKKIIFSIIIIVIFALITIFVIIFNHKEIEVSFEPYKTAVPMEECEFLKIERVISSIIDYESLISIANEESGYCLEMINFSDEAYLIASGKQIKRIYYKYFDKIEMYSGQKGHILYIEYYDTELTNIEYIYIIDNSEGPFCTEDEVVVFDG